MSGEFPFVFTKAKFPPTSIVLLDEVISSSCALFANQGITHIDAIEAGIIMDVMIHKVVEARRKINGTHQFV